MPATRLAQLIQQAGILSQEDAEFIAKNETSSGSSFAKLLVALNIFNEKKLAAFIAEHTQIPLYPERAYSAEPAAMNILDQHLMAYLEVFPLFLKNNVLTVLMPDPLDSNIIEQLRFFLPYKIKPVVGSFSTVYKSIAQLIPGFAPKSTTLGRFLQKRSLPAAYKHQTSVIRFAEPPKIEEFSEKGSEEALTETKQKNAEEQGVEAAAAFLDTEPPLAEEKEQEQEQEKSMDSEIGDQMQSGSDVVEENSLFDLDSESSSSEDKVDVLNEETGPSNALAGDLDLPEDNNATMSVLSPVSSDMGQPASLNGRAGHLKSLHKLLATCQLFFNPEKTQVLLSETFQSLGLIPAFVLERKDERLEVCEKFGSISLELSIEHQMEIQEVVGQLLPRIPKAISCDLLEDQIPWQITQIFPDCFLLTQGDNVLLKDAQILALLLQVLMFYMQNRLQ